MEKLATIEKIHSIQPHPNPEVEKLEIGKIKEWPVVIPKGQFANGQLVVFIQIDSIVPEIPEFEFMRRQKFRVWNAKFKGAPSQGLVMYSLSLNKYLNIISDNPASETGIDVKQYNEGDDVTELLGITKYEKPLDLSIRGDAVGGFPTHLVSITDEENLLNNPKTLEEFRGQECYLTVKADGSSMTVIYDGEKVRVCSRRLEQKEGSGFWLFAEALGLPDKLKELKKSVAIQAEACGGKIQGNPMGLTLPSFFVFNVKEIDTGKWYGYREIADFCSSLQIPMVKLVREPFIFDETWTIDTLQAIANLTEYTTAKGETRKAEGIVLRPTTPKFSAVLGHSLSVKILNQDYKQ
jgi:RNA ligase (TIGR02306 family)